MDVAGDTVRESTVEATGFPRPGDDGAGWVNISLDRCWRKKTGFGDLLVWLLCFPTGDAARTARFETAGEFCGGTSRPGLVCCLLALPPGCLHTALAQRRACVDVLGTIRIPTQYRRTLGDRTGMAQGTGRHLSWSPTHSWKCLAGRLLSAGRQGWII